MTGQNEATLSFQNPPLPDSGQVQAFYYENDAEQVPVQRAASPVVTIPPVTMLVNGQPSGTAVTINGNDPLFVKVLNHSGQATDYIGLYRIDSGFDQLVDTQFLDGSTTTPPGEPGEEANLEFHAVLAAGVYAVRLFQEGRSEPIATFQPIHVLRIIPALTVNGVAPGGALTMAQGALLQVGVTNPPAFIEWALQLWVDGTCCEGGGLRGSWTVEANQTTFAPMAAPIEPGTYRFYLIDVTPTPTGEVPQSASVEVRLPLVTVNGLTAPQPVWTRPGRSLQVHVQYAADLTDHVRLTPLASPAQVLDTQAIVGTQVLATATLTMPSSGGPFEVDLYHVNSPPFRRVGGPEVTAAGVQGGARTDRAGGGLGRTADGAYGNGDHRGGGGRGAYDWGSDRALRGDHRRQRGGHAEPAPVRGAERHPITMVPTRCTALRSRWVRRARSRCASSMG